MSMYSSVIMGPIPIKSIPAFAPPKNIDVANVINPRLRNRL